MSALPELINKIAVTRQGSYVRRFHAKPLIGEQNLGHHSFGALSLLLLLHPDPSPLLIKAVLWHDMAEQYVGDVPSPALRDDQAYGLAYLRLETAFLQEKLGLRMTALSRDELDWLWAIDKLECLLFSREQYQLGNMAFARVCSVLWKWFHDEQHRVPAIIQQIVVALKNAPRNVALGDVLDSQD